MIRSFCPSALVTLGLAVALLSACGGSSGSGPAGSGVTPTGGTIGRPVTVNLYPNSSSQAGPRLAVMATSVGSASVSMPLVFDTGSAGVTLYAPSIFPADMVSTAGFMFPPGQTSLTYNGITVTNQQGTRTYGSTRQRRQNGNIGYATLTFGDAQGRLTTAVMPLFFYYSETDVTTGSELGVVGALQGVFGVAANAGMIVLPGSTEPSAGLPACASDSNSTCYVVSPLKYLQYGAGMTAGFVLSPATIQSCDITIAGSCSPEPILTLGLGTGSEAGFSMASVPCPPNGYSGPTSIAGYPVCQKIIENATVMVSGSVVGSLTGAVVFDTGTPDMQIALPTSAGSAFPTSIPSGSSVMFTTPSGFTYLYDTSSTLPFATVVDAGYTGSSIVGIGYFTTHSLLLDFTSGATGWK